MDQFEELEKYKQLLDAGAINEKEFTRLKCQLLGLKSEEDKLAEQQAKREAALAEIEKIRQDEALRKAEEERIKKEETEKIEEERRIAEERERLRKEETLRQEKEAAYQKKYAEEKAKEDARLAALADAKTLKNEERREIIQEKTKKLTKVVGSVILWIVAVILLLLSISSFSMMATGSFNFFGGIILLVLAVMACPLVTEMTKDNTSLEFYYQHKKVFVLGFILLWFILAGFMLQ